MSPTPSPPSPPSEGDKPPQHAPFKAWKIVVGVMLALLAVNLWFRLYTEEVSLPRYCDTREQTLVYLEKVITDPRPAGEENRRPYLIAAKLLYLYPREGDEALEDYLARVGELIKAHCQ